MAVKLGQDLNTLYDLEYLEYSLLLNLINDEIEENNKIIEKENNETLGQTRLGIPQHLKPK